MTKRKYNRKAVKGAMVTEYLNKNGYATPEVLAAEVGVSESYAAKWLRKWKLAKRNWGTSSEEQATPEDKSPQVHKTHLSDTKLADNAQPAPMMQALAGRSDGSTASYYELPDGAKELQDLISFKDMNAQMGEIFRGTYRYGEASHSDRLRDAKKIRFYIDAEIKRLGG